MLYKYPDPIGDVTVIVPKDCPVIVCVLPATGVIVTPAQGLGGGGGAVVSDFLQLVNKLAAIIIPESNVVDFSIFKCTIN